MADVEAPSSTVPSRDAKGRDAFKLAARANEPITVPSKRANQIGVVLFEKAIDFDFARAVAGELIATCFFLFANISVIQLGQVTPLLDPAKHLLIAISFGLNIMLLVFMFAGISGANINPAVTFCLVLGKHISVVRAGCYIVAQCLGAIIGAAFAKAVTDSYQFGLVAGGANIVNTDNFSEGRAMFGEILCTALLCLTVLAGTNGELWRLMSVVKITPNLPAALGVVVTIAHLIMIPIDGCSINPARSFGPAVVADEWTGHWVFWIGPLLGSVLALALWEGILRPPIVINPKDDLPTGHSINTKLGDVSETASEA